MLDRFWFQFPIRVRKQALTVQVFVLSTRVSIPYTGKEGRLLRYPAVTGWDYVSIPYTGKEEETYAVHANTFVSIPYTGKEDEMGWTCYHATEFQFPIRVRKSAPAPDPSTSKGCFNSLYG